jgi:hypothetical protein
MNFSCALQSAICGGNAESDNKRIRNSACTPPLVAHCLQRCRTVPPRQSFHPRTSVWHACAAIVCVLSKVQTRSRAQPSFSHALQHATVVVHMPMHTVYVTESLQQRAALGLLLTHHHHSRLFPQKNKNSGTAASDGTASSAPLALSAHCTNHAHVHVHVPFKHDAPRKCQCSLCAC